MPTIERKLTVMPLLPMIGRREFYFFRIGTQPVRVLTIRHYGGNR